MEGQQAVRVTSRRRLVARLQRLLHRLPESRPVELQRVRAADGTPDLGSLAVSGIERERAMEVEQALVDVIPSHRQVSRAPQPEDRLSAQALEL